MVRLAWVWPEGGERWRKPAIVALSLGLHGVVLGYMALDTFDGSRRYGESGSLYDPYLDPPIYIQIEPRPLLRGETARTRQTTPDTRTFDTVPDAGARQTDFAGATGSETADVRPEAPSPRLSAPGAPTPPADVGTAPWRVRPETLGDRVGRGLRTRPVGCSSPGLLTAAERAICDDRFGARAATAAPIQGSGAPGRDARFAREGARALAEYEARRRPLSGGIGIIGVQEGPGSNFGMGVAGAHLDPALRPDSTTNVRTRRDRVREAEED